MTGAPRAAGRLTIAWIWGIPISVHVSWLLVFALVAPEEALLGALQKMDDAKVAQLPVVADGHWLGMLDREHILHYMRVRAELGV